MLSRNQIPYLQLDKKFLFRVIMLNRNQIHAWDVNLIP